MSDFASKALAIQALHFICCNNSLHDFWNLQICSYVLEPFERELVLSLIIITGHFDLELYFILMMCEELECT
jgi:hypothetical protein